MNPFKDILNAHYVSTHFGLIHPATPEEFESYARHYRRVYTPFLPDDKEAPILDVGCGLGRYLYFLRQQGYVNHFGVDIGQEQIDFCRQHVTEQVELVSDTRSYLIDCSERYDVIVCNDVLEHLDEDELFPILESVREALTSRGKLIVSVPNAACITALMTRYGDMTHQRLFTEGSLTQLLLSAGFLDVRIFPNEKKVIRSYGSHWERYWWTFRDKLVRWLMAEFYRHLMEGAYPRVQTINLLGVAGKCHQETSSK